MLRKLVDQTKDKSGWLGVRLLQYDFAGGTIRGEYLPALDGAVAVRATMTAWMDS